MPTLSGMRANWRTSTLGASLILGGVADALQQLATGAFDPVTLKADALAAASGWGLVLAKDHNVTGGTQPQ